MKAKGVFGVRLSVCIPCFFGGMDLAKAVRKVKELGYDAAEIWQDWLRADLGEVKKACDETGVRILSMCVSEFRLTEPEARDAWLEGLEKSCKAANELGIPAMITQTGPDTDAPREEQHNQIVETLKLALPILEKYGVTLWIEPLNTLYEHKGHYLWSAVEGAAIVREVGHPLVKMVFDIYHLQVMEGNIINNITNNLDCIAHLHAAGSPGRHEMQFGENDYKVIFAAVEKAGYTGWCGLEYMPTLPPEESLLETKRIYG